MDEQTHKIVKTMINLFKTPYSRDEDIAQMEGIMANALAETPIDVTIAVSLLQAKVMLGKTQEAINLAERIWSIGGNISKKTEALYITLLNSLCMFNYSKSLLTPRLSMDFEQRNKLPDVGNLLITCFIGLGNIETLSKIAKFDELEEKKEIIEAFCSQMIEDGAKEHFMWQQRKIHENIYKKCSSFDVILSADRGYPEVEVGIFAGGDSVDRYQLQKNIDKAYNDYYDAVQFTPLDNFLATVYDIKEHWAFDGSLDE